MTGRVDMSQAQESLRAGLKASRERLAEAAARIETRSRRWRRIALIAYRRGRRAALKNGRTLRSAAGGWLGETQDRLAAMKGSPAHHGALLAAFALTAAGLLAASDDGTRAAIAARAAEDLQRSLGQVVPEALRDGALEEGSVADPETGARAVYRARKNGAVSAVAFETVGQGYGGEIRILLGVDAEGRLLGVRVLSHSETPGLGDRIEASKSDWAKGFEGRSLQDPAPAKWAVKKDGGVFDQFSGATITPRAVVGAVRRGLEFFKRSRAALLDLKPDAQEARKP